MALPDILARKLRLPLIGAPMFIVSVPDLVVAQCTAGIVGSFPALNARPQERLEEWIVDIKTRVAAYKESNPDAPVAPFAVNQIKLNLSFLFVCIFVIKPLFKVLAFNKASIKCYL